MSETTIHYEVGISFPHRHFISITGRFPVNGKTTLIQLAAWRPGRYELGNFSKNIRAWKSEDGHGNTLSFRKLNKDIWEVDCDGVDEVVIRYQYYAPDINAGSTFLGEDQLYMNPVNCFFFQPEYPERSFEIQFNLPADYEIATGLVKIDKHKLSSSSFDELADCPLIASNNLQHLQYKVENKSYHIWIQGSHPMDVERMMREFGAFTKVHLNLFGTIPCDEYHFLFQITPHFVRHGVEHRNSTVIAMGPSADLAKESWYNEFLGISCHELFHTWNVKCFRPADMVPYDFSGENYSRLGYVYEGVTTYYGDQLLLRSGVFDESAYIKTFDEVLEKHYNNPGRHNHSVADSSFDTWLDGYSAGIPWRKVSIYTEGCLIAFICDMRIRNATANRFSLDDVMKTLYELVDSSYTGFTEDEYWELLSNIAGIGFEDIRNQLVNGTSDYTPFIQTALNYIGFELESNANTDRAAAQWGMMIERSAGKMIVTNIVENSPADLAGIWIDDQVVSVGGTEVNPENWKDVMNTLSGEMQISVLRKTVVHEKLLSGDGKSYFPVYTAQRMESASPAQLNNYRLWGGQGKA